MKKTSKTLTKLVDEFLEYCELEKELSLQSVEKYAYRLTRFLEWLRENVANSLGSATEPTLNDLTYVRVRKFRLYLKRRGLAHSTRYHYLVVLRSFLKYLVREDYPVPVDPAKIELGHFDRSRSIKFLTPAQLEALLRQPEVKNKVGLRDRAILELLFSTGLRVSELVSLNVSDLDLERQEFSVVGKGGRRRVVFLSKTAKEWLQRYLKARTDGWAPLFISYSGPKRQKGVKGKEYDSPPQKAQEVPFQQEGREENEVTLDPRGEARRLTVRSVQRMIKKYARKAGLGVDATPHTLRHTFATDLLQAGADIRVVQESLGHKNISTTQIYTHVTNFNLREAHQKFHGKWRRG